MLKRLSVSGVRLLSTGRQVLAADAANGKVETPGSSGSNAGASTREAAESPDTATPKSSQTRWSKRASATSLDSIPKMTALQNALWTTAGEREVIAPEFLPNLTRNGATTYDPFDLGMAKIRLDRRNRRQPADRFDILGLDPLALWKMPTVLSSNFTTTNGKIIAGHMHGTKGRNHRRLAKAIRRCRAAGLLSHVHRSVDLL